MTRVRTHVRRTASGKFARVRDHERLVDEDNQEQALHRSEVESEVDSNAVHDVRAEYARRIADAPTGSANEKVWRSILNSTADARTPSEAVTDLTMDYRSAKSPHERANIAFAIRQFGHAARPGTSAKRALREGPGAQVDDRGRST